MINENRIQFFETLLKSLKWKWTEEEQLALWDKFPFDIQNGNFGKLLVSIVENLDTKPKKPALKKYVWDFSKGLVEGKKKTVIEHAGCNNCVAGYIRLPDLRQFKEYDFPMDMSNLTHFSWWTTDFLCSCTGNTRFREKVEEIKNLVFQNPELYEFCFIAMFCFFQESVNPKRFKDIKDFKIAMKEVK